VLGFALVTAIAGHAVADEKLKVDPRGSYLRANQDSPRRPLILSLSDYGIAPDDHLRLWVAGDWKRGTDYQDDTRRGLAVFSTSDELLATSERHRIPGAIDAGCDWITSKTHFGGLDTDIPEDFAICGADASEWNGAALRVPDGAGYLFIAVNDSYYADNTDPDSDFYVYLRELAASPKGDMNCDELLDFSDIDPFVVALIGSDRYLQEYPDCIYLNADINEDCSVDFLDIDGFVDCLIDGGCE
jgi:hypothetical protein